MPDRSPRLTAIAERIVFGRRRITLAFFALATLAMAWQATSLRVDAGFLKLVPVEHEYMRTFLEYREEFGGANRVAVAVIARDGDIFTPEFFARLEQITELVFFLPGVDRTQVYSLFTPNVRYLETVEDGVNAGNVLPADFQPTEAGFSAVRENILKAGIVGRLVANDFSGALVSAQLQEFNPNTGERLDYQNVYRSLEEIRAEVGGSGSPVEIHIIGFAQLVGEIASGASRVALFFALTIVLTAFFLFIHTRSVRFTLLPIACAMAAMVWQLGAIVTLGYGIDPMSILVPFLVFAIGVSHGVQMVGATQAESFRGVPPLDAARTSFRRILLPGVVALASDTAGFITISLIEVPVIQEIALSASLGVAAIILTNLALLPVLLSFARTGESDRDGALVRDRRLHVLWTALTRFTRRGPSIAIIVVFGNRRGRKYPLRLVGANRRSSPRRPGIASGFHIQPGCGHHRETVRDRCRRVHGICGIPSRWLHRIPHDEPPRPLRMAYAQCRRRPVRRRHVGCRPCRRVGAEGRRPELVDHPA